jgi:hypothetical protein
MMGFVIYLSFRHSAVLWCDALGAQLIESPAAGAFDDQADVLPLGQFAAAVAAAYFSHCKPFSIVER